MKKTLLLFTTTALALLLAAGVALAQNGPAQQTTIHFAPSEFGTIFPDPCNLGEEVTITGTAKGSITEVLTPTGAYMYTLHLSQFGTGVGTEGSEYRWNNTSVFRFRSEDQASDATVFTAAGPLLLINKGSGPNLVVHSVYHLTGLQSDPVVEVRVESSECRG
jgi:hypothetical protein